jgi:hypothetical protein
MAYCSVDVDSKNGFFQKIRALDSREVFADEPNA